MKRIFLTTIAFTFLLNVKLFAQLIPNAGFENWTVITSYSDPDQWMTGNQGSSGLGLGAGVNESSVFHGGASAMELKTVGTAFNFPGVAVSGTLASAGLGAVTFGGGFPCTTKYQKLTGYYQYTAGNGIDSAFVKVIFFKRNGANRDTIAVGEKGLSSTAATYTQFEALLNYKNFTTIPDSALIIIQSSKNLLAAQAGSIMLVDDLLFTGDVTSVKNINLNSSSVSVYPNPANALVNFSISNTSIAKTLNIYDILGSKVKTVEITSAQLSVSTDGLNNSLYFYQVADRNNNIISTGKFSVKK